jgi:integrase
LQYRIKLYKGVWHIVWNDGGTKRQSLGPKTDKAAAERALEDFKRAGQPANRVSVAQIMEAYLADKADKASHERMKWAWERLKDHFGALRPDQITREQCRAYVAKRRRRGRGDNTIRKELTTLRSALRWQDRNTPAIVEMPSMPTPREVFITREQFQHLHDAAVAPHIKLFLMLAWFTAGRKEAILSLTWDQLDFKRGVVDLGAGVGNKGRAKPPMSPSLKRALQESKKGAVTEWVVEWAGGRVKSIRKGFDKAALAAGLEHITPHDLRRSAARVMIEKGIPMGEVSQYLGHSSTSVTEKVYGRFSPGYLRRAAEALE